MGSLAGIIHPSAYQITELLGMMSHAFPPSTFGFFRHKNLEICAWGEILASNERKTIWAMVDGTIHNALSLRNELAKLGFQFKTHTDAELIVAAYDAWEEACISRLNGQFAIVLFDEKRELLYLIRDRLGKKNLYWSTQGEYWLFSTEIKGLLASGIVPQTPSVVGLGSYLNFGFIPQDMSPIKGVNKLLPGHFLKIDLNRRLTIGQFWSFSALLEKKEPLAPDTVYHEFGKLLEDSVRTALPTEGTFGLLNSGTAGSLAIQSYLEKLTTKERIYSFSADFTPPLPGATQSTLIDPEEALSNLVALVWEIDEPIADPYILQTWCLAELAAKNTNSVFADLGWEEFLAGHARYFLSADHPSPRPAGRIARLPEGIRRKLILPLCNFFHLDCKWSILRNIDINQEQIDYQTRIALFQEKERKSASPLLYRYFNQEVFTQRFHRLAFVPGSIDPFLYFDAKTELPDRLLTQYERLFTSRGVNLLTPYLDHRLVEFLASVPEEIKTEQRIPAIMLKNHLRKLAQEKVLKEGGREDFIERWRHHPLFRDVFGLLTKGLLVEEGLISPKWIQRQLSFPYLTPLLFRQLWALLVLEIWFRLYIHKPIGLVDLKISVYDFLS